MLLKHSLSPKNTCLIVPFWCTKKFIHDCFALDFFKVSVIIFVVEEVTEKQGPGGKQHQCVDNNILFHILESPDLGFKFLLSYSLPNRTNA